MTHTDWVVSRILFNIDSYFYANRGKNPMEKPKLFLPDHIEENQRKLEEQRMKPMTAEEDQRIRDSIEKYFNEKTDRIN